VRARPFLIGGTASPTLGEMVLFQTDGAAAYTPIEFAADVVSDDGGEELQSVLLVDHGDASGASNGPFADYVPGEPLGPSFVPCPFSGSSARSHCDGL
jgi:hypothetical protein